MVDDTQLQRRDGLAMVLNADGFGTPPVKISKYHAFTRAARSFDQGFKLFYEEDLGLMSPVRRAARCARRPTSWCTSRGCAPPARCSPRSRRPRSPTARCPAGAGRRSTRGARRADARRRRRPRRRRRAGRGAARCRSRAAGALGFAAELAGVATGKPFGHYSLLGQARAAGRRRAAARGRGVGDDGAAVVGRRGAPDRAARCRGSPLAAGALTAWDVFLDPRMAREGYWTWPGGGRYEGVPASNFLGWWVTGAACSRVWSLLDGERAGRGRRRGARALRRGPGRARRSRTRSCGAGRGWPAAGALAMGAFAVPALRRRWRA